MPPKGKTEDKKKAKVVEDKTFGLKNKNKSKKVQKFIQSVQATVQPKKKGPLEPTKKELKEEEAKRKEEIASLFKPVIESKQKVAPGVDPKSIVCEFFMKGTCKKGSKCKFSHDLDMARKSAKIDIYSDRRDEDENTQGLKGADGEYDENTLMEAIEKKANRVQTTIVCKHFIEAIEKKVYGWFWECPNGPTCIYRHALPPGFVLKSMMKKEEESDDEDKLTIEEELDELRSKITSGTPVNAETFAAWKRRKLEAKQKAAEEARLARDKEVKSGRKNMSGRELFAFNPELFADDEEAMGGDQYVQDEDNQEPLYDISNLGKNAINPDAQDDDQPTTADGGEGVPVDESLFADDDDDEDDEDEDEDGGEEEGEDGDDS